MIQPLKEEDEVGETVKRTLLFPAPPRDSSTSTVDDARVSLSHLSEFNIESLRALNGALFPVSYNDRFYRDLLGTYPSDLSLLAYVKGHPVGAICCRKEAWDRDRKTGRRAYIMTLGVLPEYRRLRIGSLLLERILANLSSSPSHQDLDWVCLHVQSANKAAHSFYESHGFRVLEWVEGYYERNLGVIPPDAFLLGLDLHRSRLV